MTKVQTEYQLNVPLLNKVLEHIESHPEEWDQGAWIGEKLHYDENYDVTACGTTFCFAGHAAFMSGASLVPRQDGEGGFSSELIDTPDGARWHVYEYAKSVLGLTSLEADLLFESDNTLYELKLLVNGIIAGRYR